MQYRLCVFPVKQEQLGRLVTVSNKVLGASNRFKCAWLSSWIKLCLKNIEVIESV